MTGCFRRDVAPAHRRWFGFHDSDLPRRFPVSVSSRPRERDAPRPRRRFASRLSRRRPSARGFRARASAARVFSLVPLLRGGPGRRRPVVGARRASAGVSLEVPHPRRVRPLRAHLLELREQVLLLEAQHVHRETRRELRLVPARDVEKPRPRLRVAEAATLGRFQKRVHGLERGAELRPCLLYTSPSPRDMRRSRMPSSA